jgi:catechol 2,3-dioxygenase-like lactoylglutathione lyase family enzyme
VDAVGFTPLGLDHVVLRVRDQAIAERFYCDVLGCTLERVNAPISLVQLRFGAQLIDLLPAPPAGPGPADQRGIDHVCLSIGCDDLDAVARRLRARGVRIDGEIVQRYGAWGVGPSLYLRDPDDYLIELKPRRIDL